MNSKLPLPEDKKLVVIYRIEPGCLGPKGKDRINDFCLYSQKAVESINSDFIHWKIIPRNNKSLPEMEYEINKMKLSHDKAERYLQLFEKKLDTFEDQLHEKISILIDLYLGHE